MTIYSYGWMAWVWRVLAVAGIAAAGLLVVLATRFGEWVFVVMALPLAVPSIVLPWMVALRVDQEDRDTVVVTNLWFVRRRIHQESLGRPRLRHTAQAAFGHIPAPRVWIPVQGGLPVYLDLYAHIPEPTTLRTFFRLP